MAWGRLILLAMAHVDAVVVVQMEVATINELWTRKSQEGS
jgi:hypothetical protein